MNILKRIKQNGIRYSFAIAFNRLVPEKLFRCRRYVVYQLAQPQRNAKTNSPVNVRWCRSEPEYEAVENLTQFRRSPEHRGYKACRATVGGELAGGAWCAKTMFRESALGVSYKLTPGQVWLFAAMVDTRFRRQGVYREVLRFMLAETDATGLLQKLVAVNPDNIGSNKIHQLHASRKLGTVVAIRVFKTTVCFTFGDIKRDRTIAWNCDRNPVELTFPIGVNNQEKVVPLAAT